MSSDDPPHASDTMPRAADKPAIPRPRAARAFAWAGLMLAAAGWWLSFDLLLISQGRDATNPLVQAQCGGADGSSSGCQSVLFSERAKGPMGIPWAALGMAYFAFVGVWYGFVGVPQRGTRLWLLPVAALVALGLLSSVQLIAVMALVLKTWCFGCLLTHGVNAGLGIVTIAAFMVGGTPKPGPVYPTPRLAAAALFAGLTLFLLNITFVQLGRVMGAVGLLQGELLKITEDAEYIRVKYRREPKVSIPLRDDEPWFGDSDAPNTLVAFADFQCAICRKAAQIIADALQRHPGRMRVTYRHFPQDSDCNAHYPTRAHPAACAAARAAEAALAAGGADAYHRMRSLLYERQRDLELDRYEAWAGELGLDSAAFAAAFGSDEIQNTLKEHTELGRKLGITAVPVLYLNGKRLKLWQSPAIWDALLSDPPTTQPAAP